MEEPYFDDDNDTYEAPPPYRPSLLTIIISILILVSFLATLLLPIMRDVQYRQRTPTPTPFFKLEAHSDFHWHHPDHLLQ